VVPQSDCHDVNLILIIPKTAAFSMVLAFENWSFWNLFCISVAIEVIKKEEEVLT